MGALGITVDVTSPTPPYEHSRSQIAALVAGGVLRAGDRLLTMRALAADLGVATGTVVTGAAPRPPDDQVRRTATQLAVQAREAGLDGESVLALVRAALGSAQRQDGM